MNLPRTFLALSYLLILISIVAHELASDQYVFLAITPLLLFVAWRFEAAGRPLRLPEPLPTILTLGAFLIVMSQGIDRESLLELGLFDVQVATVGKFLIAFQWISLFRDKTPRDYGWVYLVTVVLMGIAGLLMPSLGYGALLLLYALVGVAALTVFHLWAQAQAAGGDMENEVKVSVPLLLSAIPMVMLALPPLIAIFMALPRQNIRMVSRLAMGRAQAVAGFSESVQLGEVGAIQDNPQRVMTVSITDPESGAPVEVADLLLRGVVLENYRYEDGHWTWSTDTLGSWGWNNYDRALEGDVTSVYRRNFPEFPDLPYQLVRFDISIERISSSLLFTPFAAERIIPRQRVQIQGHPVTHIFRRTRRGNQLVDYTVISRLLRSAPDNVAPSPSAYDEKLDDYLIFLEVPQGISNRVVELAQRIAPMNLPAEERARRIFNYLSDGNRFAYTLNREPTPKVEPVEDFLFNENVGHCEYFASAMALMLRCVGIPSRMVNGFKVWEYSPLQERYIVRQSNAHSWVEAYIRPHGWRTYDPSVQRQEVADQGSARAWFRNVYDSADSLWNKYVTNYSQDQRASISRFLQRGINSVRRFIAFAINTVAGELFVNEMPLWKMFNTALGRPMKIVGIVIAGLGVLAAFLQIGRVSFRLWNDRERRASIMYYRKMERILARKGRHRRRSQTPWEFHEELHSQNWPEIESVALVTDCFCRARYAGQLLNADQLADIRLALQRIAMAQRAKE